MVRVFPVISVPVWAWNFHCSTHKGCQIRIASLLLRWVAAGLAPLGKTQGVEPAGNVAQLIWNQTMLFFATKLSWQFLYCSFALLSQSSRGCLLPFGAGFDMIPWYVPCSIHDCFRVDAVWVHRPQEEIFHDILQFLATPIWHVPPPGMNFELILPQSEHESAAKSSLCTRLWKQRSRSSVVPSGYLT